MMKRFRKITARDSWSLLVIGFITAGISFAQSRVWALCPTCSTQGKSEVKNLGERVANPQLLEISALFGGNTSLMEAVRPWNIPKVSILDFTTVTGKNSELNQKPFAEDPTNFFDDTHVKWAKPFSMPSIFKEFEDESDPYFLRPVFKTSFYEDSDLTPAGKGVDRFFTDAESAPWSLGNIFSDSQCYLFDFTKTCEDIPGFKAKKRKPIHKKDESELPLIEV